MTSGYHHMELSAEAKPKSAFVTPVDKYEFNRCPFGLAQAPAYFQRLVNKVLAELPFTYTKEEAEAAAGDDKDRDPDYVRSEEDSSMDPTYAPSRKELRRADEEGDK